MPANTSKGYPYPLGTDRLMDGDDAIKNLATAVDAKLGVTSSGRFMAADSATAGAVVTTVLTFPVGLFTAPPIVMLTNETTNPTGIAQSAALNLTTVSTASIRTARAGATGGIPVAWVAFQVP